MADKTGLRLQRSWVLQMKNLSVTGNFKREIIMRFCHKPTKRHSIFQLQMQLKDQRVCLTIFPWDFSFPLNNVTLVRNICKHNSHFSFFSSYGAWAECFILWSVTEQCFIAKWNEAASSEKAFLWSTPDGVWSGTACHEAHLRCMKRSLFRLHSPFLPQAKMVGDDGLEPPTFTV